MSARIKAKYLLICIIVNFILYFSIQAFITHGNYNFLTSFDLKIPFIPEFIWLYHTLLPVIMLTTILAYSRKEVFFTCLSSYAVVIVIMSLFYVFLPSFYPRPHLTVNSISSWLVEMTYYIDGSHNTTPSGHVTFAWVLFFTFKDTLLALRCKYLKYVYFFWAVLISISTLVLKQHYIIDVISGFILASTCYYIVKKYFRNKKASNY